MKELKKTGVYLVIVTILITTFIGCGSKIKYKNGTNTYTYAKYYYKIKRVNYIQDKKGKSREIILQLLSKKIITTEKRDYYYNPKKPSIQYDRGSYYGAKTTYGDWEPLKNKRVSIDVLSNYFNIDSLSNLVTDSEGKIKIKVNVVYDNIYFAGVKENLKSLKLNKKLFSDKYSSEEDEDGIIIKYKDEKYTQKFVIIDTDKSKDRIAQELERSIEDKVNQIYAKKFNSVNISVEDIDTRYELKNPDITIQGKPPKIRNILKPFFKNKKHLDIAVNKFPTVVNGEKKGSNYTSFPLYIGGTYKVMIKHPLYNYLEKKIKIKPKTKKITIRMAELGTKHRVKIVEQ